MLLESPVGSTGEDAVPSEGELEDEGWVDSILTTMLRMREYDTMGIKKAKQLGKREQRYKYLLYNVQMESLVVRHSIVVVTP